MTDLWPKEFGEIQERPPVAILKDQALAISKRTGGKILGEVRTNNDRTWDFLHRLSLVAPFLGDYTYHLLSVRHSILLYPLKIYVDATDVTYDCLDPAAFVDTLRAVLGSDEVKRVIAAILAQTEAVR